MRASFFSLSYSDLSQELKEQHLPEEGARQLFNWYYKKGKDSPCVLHNLSSRTERWLNEKIDFELPTISQIQNAEDKTVKFNFRLKDEFEVESVLIPFQNKYTVCLSSQVGCAMKCSFCFTGEQGFSRHLKTEEIVGQFMQIQKWLSRNRPEDDRILNIVFMGQGEPLHNFDAVKKACEIFLSQHGLSIACHKITVSTAGYLPGILRWEKEMPNVNIALSLHSVVDEKRNQLIPLNKAYPLSQIFPIIDKIPKDKKRFVTYEYLVLDGYNDSEEEIHLVGNLLKDKKAFINLIPFNPYPGARYKRPADDRVLHIRQVLESYRIPTTIRSTKGERILAACGQLNSAQST
ncbi:23S rRNA (adenine(2503)-C(2))-methyltransferase RlmN [bacterium]|nr:23S rRNA (adenine(2503)-C(2))-methyltransferase RlmN [bacterium]